MSKSANNSKKSNRSVVKNAPKTPKDEIRLFKIEPNWTFKGVYSGINDPMIEKDMVKIENGYASFAKKYSSQSSIEKFTTDSAALKQALDDFNDLLKYTSVAKPTWYLHLVCDLDTRNAKAKALQGKAEERLRKAANQIMFFNLVLGKISPAKQSEFLDTPSLALYKTFLQSIFEISKFNLSEAEEKILSLKSAASYSMWVSTQSKYMTSQMVMHKGKKIPITEAMAIKGSLPLKERRALHKEVFTALKAVSFLAEAELNAIINDKRVIDELRGFTKSYEATVLGYQNTVASVESLVASVSSRFKDSQEFFKLKAQALGLPKLTIAELSTPISKNKKKYSIGEGVGLVYEAFNIVKPEFAEMFSQYVQNGQMDFYPKQGKRNGAYCSWGNKGEPTHILLNHTDDFNSISTLAHEMGHAIHGEFSQRDQEPINAEITISVAEVASTFFENVLFDFVYERSSPEEQKTMLLEQIQDNVFTIYAQIGYFNFEKDLHAGIKEKGELTAAEMAALFLKNRKQVLGPAFDYTEDDGYSYVATPHFRYFFYVYAYAYGQLIANAMYAEYKKNPAFLSNIEQFLSAGCSLKPDDIFKSIGIDVKDPEFFNKGLDEIARKIKVVKGLMKAGSPSTQSTPTKSTKTQKPKNVKKSGKK